MPGAADSPPLVVSQFPDADPSMIDDAAEAELSAQIELTRELRRWRSETGIPAGAVIACRVAGEQTPHELVGRLARVEVGGEGGETLATIGPLELLDSGGVGGEQVRERLEKRRAELRSEVERGERKLANEGFVAKAPAEVVEAERRKLDGYLAELAALDD